MDTSIPLSITLKEISERIGGTLEGNPRQKVFKFAEIDKAGEGDIAFCANQKYLKYIETTQASCVILDYGVPASRTDISIIRVPDAYAAFMKMQQYFASAAPPAFPAGIHPTALISKSAKIGENVAIGPYAVISERAVIGDNTAIYPHVTLGDDTSFGEDCIIYPHVSVYRGSKIGRRTIIHSGAVIGSDGFGFAESDGKHEKIPQLGIVVIGDDVEIGANTTIDRATLGETVIGSGSKIDNLVQIGHNVVIGENAIIVAQSGVSGSVKIGQHVTLAGQSGIAGHLEIGDNVIITAQSGVGKSITKPGMYLGSPVQEYRTALKAESMRRKLPELIEELNRLKDRIREIEEILNRRELK